MLTHALVYLLIPDSYAYSDTYSHAYSYIGGAYSGAYSCTVCLLMCITHSLPVQYIRIHCPRAGPGPVGPRVGPARPYEGQGRARALASWPGPHRVKGQGFDPGPTGVDPTQPDDIYLSTW